MPIVKPIDDDVELNDKMSRPVSNLCETCCSIVPFSKRVNICKITETRGVHFLGNQSSSKFSVSDAVCWRVFFSMSGNIIYLSLVQLGTVCVIYVV